MSYVKPAEFVKQMVDAGEAKTFLSTRDTLIRAYMAGAILALAAAFAVTITVRTGEPLLGAVLFPVGFCLLYLMGFDLLTGVFTLVPLALIDKRRGVTFKSMVRNFGLVFVGNFLGAFTVAVFTTILLMALGGNLAIGAEHHVAGGHGIAAADMVSAFRYVFVAAAVLLASSLTFLLIMEERPLAGPAKPAVTEFSE